MSQIKVVVLGSLVFAVVFSSIVLSVFSPKLSKNVLALGPSAPAAEAINIPIFQPVDLTPLTARQIIKLREDIVAKYQQLLSKPYTPTGVVFSALEDKLPWSALDEFFLSIVPSAGGPSAEARYIINPFLLVAPEFIGFSQSQANKIKWNYSRITESDRKSPDFPFYCKAQNLRWDARQQKGEVTYNLTSYLQQVQKWVSSPYQFTGTSLALVAYNARDFGFTHLAIDSRASSGVLNYNGADRPIELKSYLAAQDGSCAPEIRCNAAIPANPELLSVAIDKLPARIVVKLWRGAPKTADVPFHMRFDIAIQ